MNIQELLTAVDHLSGDELAQVKTRINQREAEQRREAEAWGRAFEAAAAEFRGDSSPEELDDLFKAMSLKSTPSDKGV